jgi:hypothetical protein
MPAQYEPISPSALMGKKFLEELQAKLAEASLQLQAFEQRFGKRVIKAAAKVSCDVTLSYEYDKKTDEIGYKVAVQFSLKPPRSPELRRSAYVREDDNRLMIDTAAPNDPPPQQGMLFPGGLIRIHGQQVNPVTGEVVAEQSQAEVG